MARSLVKAHERVKTLEWEPTYVSGPEPYPTKYHIPNKTKDPFRHLLRDFLAMETGKDEPIYGALTDVLARTNAVNKADPAYSEILKPMLPGIRDGEYLATQLMIMLGATVQNPELRQGYLAQELDELRHAQSETWLMRYYAKRYHDPAGFNTGAQAMEWNPFMMAFRAFELSLMACDPIEGCLSLQVVTEAAYTNPLFVALTEVAALSGDDVIPGLFLSIQSDECRHMANGFSTLSALLCDDRNFEFLQDDLEMAIWRNHRAFDTILSVVYDYNRDHSVDSRPYRECWDEWVWHDFAGSYLGKLEKFGLTVPDVLGTARKNVEWMGHTGALFLYALWPLNFWRQAAVPESSFDWFETHYPGWYGYFGPFWEDAAEWADPASGRLAMEALPEIPPLCRVCVTPCVLPRLDLAQVQVEEYGGRNHAFCSAICRRAFYAAPERYLQYQNFGERFHGWDLADAIVEMGLLREDGKTLIGQPHFSTERMWTIDDIRRVGWELRYPLVERAGR